MKARVVVRRAAELDLEAIEDWYESQVPGLGAEFRSVVEDAVVRIGETPLAYPERYQGNHRLILRRFPYVIWYRLEGESAVILACVHGKRDPRLARTRLRGE